MARKVPTQIRIDADTKKRSTELFSCLGIDMSTAVNIFLKQCILTNGIPFSVSIPEYNPETQEAMAESKRISRDPNVKGYTDIKKLMEALNSKIPD